MPMMPNLIVYISQSEATPEGDADGQETIDNEQRQWLLLCVGLLALGDHRDGVTATYILRNAISVCHCDLQHQSGSPENFVICRDCQMRS